MDNKNVMNTKDTKMSIESYSKVQLIKLIQRNGLASEMAYRFRGARRHWTLASKAELAAAASEYYSMGRIEVLPESMQTTATATATATAGDGGKAEALAAMLRDIARGAGVDPEQVAAIADERIESRADWLADLVASRTARTVRVERVDAPTVEVGVQHHKFGQLLQACSARLGNGRRLNVYLHGPAATGKTTAARAVAKALEVEFYFCGRLSEEFGLLGFRAANGEVQRTAFREAWECGGVFLFDELDASDANALVAFNGALDSDVCAFPDGMVPRHKDCVIIGAGNTTGRGATSEYNSRQKQDAAFLGRWFLMEWAHDDALETAIVGTDEFGRTALRWVRALRASARANNVDGASLSARASIDMAAVLRVGMTIEDALEGAVRKGMALDSWERMFRSAKVAIQNDSKKED